MGPKGKLLASALLTALAVLALAAPAAADDVKLDCALAGDVKVQDKLDPQFGERLTGGKGFYELRASLFCVGVSKGQPAATVLLTHSAGTYEAVMCGVGKYQSSTLDVLDSSDEQTTKWNAILADEKYVMEFAGGPGTFWWHDQADLKDTPDAKLDVFSLDPDKDGWADEKDYDFGGSIVASPDPPPPFVGAKPFVAPNTPPGHCRKSFAVQGAISIHD